MSFSEIENTTIFGMRGSGKSTLCRKIQEFYPRVIIFDTLAEYSSNDGLIVYDYEQYSNFLINNQNKQFFRLIVQFNFEDASNVEYFDEFVKLAYHFSNVCIVIEEAQNFASIHKIPPYLRQCALTGRHRKVSYITTTQRIAVLHKDLISQSHHIFSGFTDTPNDKKTLQEYGFKISEIETIDKYQFLWKEGRECRKVYNDLKFKKSNIINDSEKIDSPEIKEINNNDELEESEDLEI